MANRARNNSQESLRDLGVNSRYGQGQPVDPSVEEPAQPQCQPLTGRVFTFGNGIAGKRDALSTVSSPSSSTAATADGVPLLAADGAYMGRHINGAVTVELTSQQLARAQRGSSLWLQGGTPTDPLPNPTVQGFGALRCGVDYLNGDNVEWIGYPNGYRHVFCYYLTVRVPPASGTIRIVKRVTPDAGVVDERFPFVGSISYNPGGTFQLGMTGGEPAALDFVRGQTRLGDAPWTVREDNPPDWALASLTCTSRDSTSSVTTDGGAASIRLGAGDLVTCTYTDAPVAKGVVLVRKATRGGVGGPFSFTVRPPAGPAPNVTSTSTSGQARTLARNAITAGPGQTFTASTSAEGEGVEAGNVTGPAGRYAISETLPPPTSAGRWTLSEVVCDGIRTPVAGTSVEVDASVLTPASCTFTNTLAPAGQLRLSKATTGGTGTFSYEVNPVVPERVSEAANPTRTVTTAAQGVAATARAVSGLATGTYLVTELSPPVPGGSWRSTAIDCGPNHDVVLRNGQVEVELTGDHPTAECTFANQREPALAPAPAPAPGPSPAPAPLPVHVPAAGPAGEPSTTPPGVAGSRPVGGPDRRGSLPFTGFDVLTLVALATGATALGLALYRRRGRFEGPG